MSPEDEKLVREARERADRATGGEWFDYVDCGDPSGIRHEERGSFYDIAKVNSRYNKAANAIFIAHAHQDVPALCDLAERQSKEIDRLAGMVEAMDVRIDGAHSTIVVALTKNNIAIPENPMYVGPALLGDRLSKALAEIDRLRAELAQCKSESAQRYRDEALELGSR
jgi:hypothetical protein